MGLENTHQIAEIEIHPNNSEVVFAAAVGPGLFPKRLRRSSACACAAAAVERVQTHILLVPLCHCIVPNNCKQCKCLSVINDTEMISENKKLNAVCKPICFVKHRNASFGEIQRI